MTPDSAINPFNDINKGMDSLLAEIKKLMTIIDIHTNEINDIKTQNKKIFIRLNEIVATFMEADKKRSAIIDKLSDQVVVLETKLTALTIVDNEHMKLHFRDIS